MTMAWFRGAQPKSPQVLVLLITLLCTKRSPYKLTSTFYLQEKNAVREYCNNAIISYCVPELLYFSMKLRLP